ncbi:TPA: hypothetical protein ACJ3DW_006333, partial [Pseudomonas aeruginosa]
KEEAYLPFRLRVVKINLFFLAYPPLGSFTPYGHSDSSSKGFLTFFKNTRFIAPYLKSSLWHCSDLSR